MQNPDPWALRTDSVERRWSSAVADEPLTRAAALELITSTLGFNAERFQPLPFGTLLTPRVLCNELHRLGADLVCSEGVSRELVASWCDAVAACVRGPITASNPAVASFVALALELPVGTPVGNVPALVDALNREEDLDRVLLALGRAVGRKH